MGGGPLYSPLSGLEPLHRHQEEAARQHLLTPATTWQQQARLTWDLVAALWGRLDSQVRMIGGKKIGTRCSAWTGQNRVTWKAPS